MHFVASLPELSALLQVILIDVSLSGDNAIIIAMAAASLPPVQRRRAIAIGIGGAIALRIIFAGAAVYLLDIPGLVLVGGLMLGWVCLKVWRDIQREAEAEAAHQPHEHKTMWQAVVHITIADFSMSLDNVLAVAGAARQHVYVMAAGLVLAILMMTVAANLISGLLRRWPKLNYAGFVLIMFVAARMVYEGVREAAPLLGSILASR